MAAMQLTRTHRVLIGVVVAGALIIAAIGFAGSYAAVRELAERKGFGDFSLVFPIGIDAGICVLLALDLLLTWMRIPFPLLRQTAWLLTAATIAFNGAAAWPDPLGVGMHAVIPVLFVVSVEAARHAVGRIADITADKHMEGVRLTRWLLSPVPTFKLWRRMKLWELRSYEQVIKLEQDRLIYQARLQARFGRAWRRKAPVEALMPLRLAKYGVPLAETAPAGLAAAGIEPVLLPPAPEPAAVPAAGRELRSDERTLRDAAARRELTSAEESGTGGVREPDEAYDPRDDDHAADADHAPAPANHESPWFAAQHLPPDAYERAYENGYDPAYGEGLDPAPIPVPAGPGGRTRPLGNGPQEWYDPQERYDRYGQQQYAQEQYGPQEQYAPQAPTAPDAAPAPEPVRAAAPVQESAPAPVPRQPAPAGLAPGPAPEPAVGEDASVEDKEFAEAAYPVFVQFLKEHGDYPKVDHLDILLADRHGVRHPRSTALLRKLLPEFQQRLQAELEAEHIA
ncbi:DUF2637 domain-containing protein [Streptomyces sp. NPDC005805]|uniref:DUF2637 domain-containing protein n=1 Tax=Streptomyces sp. NPDC005805 TaxID=3157068 RepID=UPI0033E4CE21